MGRASIVDLNQIIGEIILASLYQFDKIMTNVCLNCRRCDLEDDFAQVSYS